MACERAQDIKSTKTPRMIHESSKESWGPTATDYLRWILDL